MCVHHMTLESHCFSEQLDGVVRGCDPVLVTVYIPRHFMKKVHQNILSYMSQQRVYEAQVQTEEPGAEPSASVQRQIYLRERGSEGGTGLVGWVGVQQCVYCSSLTCLHTADFHCLPTLLTITERLCTLAAAQHSYTYCGPLSKETCTTSLGVLPKRPQPQFLLQD